MEWSPHFVTLLGLVLIAMIGILCHDLCKADDREAELIEENRHFREELERLREDLE